MGPELLLLLAVLVIFFVWRGPSMLPRIGEALGRTVKDIRQNVPGAIKDDPDEGADRPDPDDRDPS